MGLKLSTVCDSGTTGEYWRVMTANMRWYDTASICVVALYVDQASRIAGKAPLLMKSYDFSGADFPFENVSADVRSLIYDKLKTLPEFSGAMDV